MRIRTGKPKEQRKSGKLKTAKKSEDIYLFGEHQNSHFSIMFLKAPKVEKKTN